MRWADLDSLNHVNNVVYLDYAAESRAMLVEDGVIGTEAAVTHMSARFMRPLLLTRRPVVVVSEMDGDVLTQHICIDREGARTDFARIVTSFGAPSPVARADVDAKPLPSRIRRSDIDASGVVGPTKTFELFQEGRILYVANHLVGLTPGRFVVGTVDVDFHEPITWRRDPYEMRGWVSRVGGSSVTIESELSDGEMVLARSTTFLIGFDLAAQKSRRFSDEEVELFRSMHTSS
jgi:acyl-CoA thioester hydrolase